MTEMSNGTLDRLAHLDALHQAEITPFGKLSQEMICLYLLDYSDKVDLDTFDIEYFNDLPVQYIVAEILDHWHTHRIAPNRRVIQQLIETHLTEDSCDIARLYKLLGTPLNPKEMPNIVKFLKDWQLERIDEQMRMPGTDLETLYRRKALIINPARSRFTPRSLAHLIKNKQTITYLVDQILTAGQPFLLFGPKKCLKTALLCDLAFALATGTKFLDHFDVPTVQNVGYISAESVEVELVDRLETIQKTRGWTQDIENLQIIFEAPKLSDAGDLAAIGEFIKTHKLQVLIIDPMYLTLLSGNSDISPSVVMQMGPLLRSVARIIQDAGATPIFCHHTKKTITRNQDLDLDDMSYAGFAEFARQSLAIWRREDLAGVAQNKLAIKTHGYGRMAAWDVDVDEPNWTIQVTSRAAQTRKKGREKAEQRKDRVLNAITTLEEEGEKTTKKAISAQAGVNPVTLNVVLTELAEEGLIRPVVRDGKVTGWSRR